MSTYFFVIFEVHYIVFRYDVCLEYGSFTKVNKRHYIRRYKTYEKDKEEWESKK